MGTAAGAGHGLGAWAEAGGESAAPWLVSAQLSEAMGVGGCRAVLVPSPQHVPAGRTGLWSHKWPA